MTLRLLLAPSGLPVSLAEAKAHLRVDTSGEDDLITGLIRAATAHLDGAAGILGRCLLTQKWALDLPAFRDEILIPLAPLVAVDAVKHLDAEGDQQTLDDARYVVVGQKISRASGQDWPTALDQANAVTVEFTAGHGAADDVPAPIRAAILLLVGHWYRNREAVNVGNIVSELPLAVRSLLTPFIYRAA